MDDRESFRDFVATHQTRLSRAAYFLAGDDDAAADLVQTALTRVASHWHRVGVSEHPYAYVRQAMLNEARNRWRRAARIREEPWDHQDGGTPAGARPATTADHATAVVDRAALGDALRSLSPRQRAVLYLRFYEDRSEADTAAELGCSVGTVKSQTHHALKRLRTRAPELLSRPTEVPE